MAALVQYVLKGSTVELGAFPSISVCKRNLFNLSLEWELCIWVRIYLSLSRAKWEAKEREHLTVGFGFWGVTVTLRTLSVVQQLR